MMRMLDLRPLILLVLVVLAGCQASGGGGGAGGGIITPPNPAYTTTISGTTNHIADGVDTSTITITVFEGATPITGVTPTFAVSGTNNFIATCTATDAGGSSTCSLKSTKAEVKTIQVLLPNFSATSTVTFAAGPAGSGSTIISAGPATADGVSVNTINVTLKDANGNPVSGQTPTFSASPGLGNTYGACSVSTAAGISTCALRSTVAGVKTLQLTTPTSITGGPAFFFAGPAVVANSTIAGTTPHQADGIDASTVLVTLRDATMNPVGGVVPTFSASGTGNVLSACSPTGFTGTSTCTLKSTVAGSKNIALVTPFAKAGNIVTFNAAIGAVVAANSTITGTSLVIANGVATSTVTITLRDAANNGVSGIVPNFSATDTGTTNVYGTCPATNASGVSTCTLASTIAESKTLQLLTPVVVTGGNVIFTAGVAVAANSTITGTSPVIADGSATSTVTITLRDATNNPVAGQTPTFSATNTGTSNVYGACSISNASGVSTCTLASNNAETKVLSITAPVSKADGSVVFTPAGASVANSTITGSSPVVADGSAVSSITITLRDASNNPIAGTIPAFSATDTGTTNSYSVCTATNASGVSTCTLSSTKAETKTLSITSPITKADGTVSFVAGAAVAATSTITGSSPVAADGTATSTITVSLKDAFSNPVAGETPTFTATDTGSTNTYGSCSVSDVAGVSTCTLASLKAETKTLSIATPVVKADGTVVFTAGTPVAANSSITGTTPVIADGSATSTVTITLADVNNNLVAGVTPTFSATDTGTTNTYGTCSASDASGISTCTLASTHAETKTLSIATPFVKAGSNVIFTPAGAIAANSTITGTGPVVADGTATSTVTITLRDGNNNPVPGEVPTFGATDTGSTNTYGTCSATNASGVSTCTLSSLKAETKTLSIATPVVKADGTVVFTAGSAVAATSTITGTTPVVADGSATSTITITLRDANNNTVAGQTPTFSATDTGTTNSYGACSVTNASGVSTCTLSSLKAESKILSIATPFVKADGTVIFTAGIPVAANSSITGTTPVIADGSATSTVTITLADVNNNLVSGVTPTFSATDTSSTNTYGTCSASNASGVSTCTLASTYAETKTLSIATPFVKAGTNVVFTSAGAVAANSTITGTSPVVADGSATSTVTITLKDANNNPVPGEIPTFGATDTGTTNSYGSCSATNASGVSTCTLSSLKAETKTLAISTPVSKSGGTVVFTAGAPVAATSTITGTSPVVADGSATSSILVTLKDANGNAVGGETPTFSATDTGTTNTYGSCSATDSSGMSICTLSSLKAEVKTLSITTPVSKADGSVTFTAGAAVAANSSITGTGPVVADGTATSTVTINLKDVNMNVVIGQVPTFSATDTSGGNNYGVCSATDLNGDSTCTLSSVYAQTKTLSIVTPVSKSGGTVVFTAGSAVAANSTITGTGPVAADGSSTSTIVITLRDGGNNPVSGLTPTFSATNTGTTNTYGSCSATNASGISTCTLSSTKAETKTLAIATPISKTGGTVVFTAGPASAVASTITGTGPVVADGSATSTVTVTLLDDFNNPVSGETPTFSATDTGSTNTYGACSSSNASGVSTCTLASLKAQTKTLSITSPIFKSDGTVVFTGGTPVAANSTITGTGPVVANGSATSTVTITLQDANSNPVAGQTPTFSATNTGTTNVYGTCSASNASGQSTCTLASNTAETKTLSIVTPVSKAGGTVVFTAGSAVAANSTITGTGPVVANGSATSTVTITLRDGGNNPVSGQTPTFTATNTGSGNTYGTCSLSDASGVSTCTLRSTKAETKTLSIATPVVKADGTVVFTAGTAVASTSTITGTGTVVADGTDASTVTITLKDINNNPVSGQTPTFTATNTGTTNVYGACSVTSALGESTCTLKSTKAQIKTLSIATPFAKAGGTVTFIAGAASSTTTTITGTTPVSADGVSTSIISITLLDQYSNPVTGTTPIFNATNTLNGNVYGACNASDATGLALCTLASTRAEMKVLQLTSPVAVTGDTVEFSSSLPVAANSTIAGTSPHAADGATDSTITITLRDSNNNPVAGIEPTFGATNTGSGNTYDTCSLSDASGVSVCTMQSTVAEIKTLQITSPVTKSGGTVTFTAGAAVAATSTITGTSPIVADNTATSTVTVTLKDAFNNLVAGTTPTFTTTGTGNTQTACSVSNASGVSTCTVKSTKAEVKTLAIATPFVKTGGTVTFTAGSPVAANSTITGTGPTNPDGTSASTITITFRDVNNNLVSGTTPTFTATGTNNTYGSCSASNASGVSTCTLRSTTAETKTLSIATPFVKAGGTVIFATGSPSIANSSISATGPVVANGVATSTITITLRDNTNAPVIGNTPTFDADGTSNTYNTCSATNSSGVSTCTMTSTRAESKTVSIATPIVKAGNTIVFTPGPAVAANSTIECDSANYKADGSDSCLITVTLMDAFNNAVSGTTPTISVSGTSNTVSACSSTDTSGSSTCTLTSTKAEGKFLSIVTPVAVSNPTEYPFYPNGIDMQVPIEMLDRGLIAGTGIVTWLRSRTSLDTSKYVADDIQYFFEVTAANTNTSAYQISLVDETNAVVPGTTFSVPGSTSAATRFRWPFDPVEGAHNYRIRTPATASSTFRIHSARIIVQMTKAVEAELYIPMGSADATGDSTSDTGSGAQIMAATTTTYTNAPTTGNFTQFLRTDSLYDAIPSTNGWTLEALMTSSATTTAQAALFDKTNNQQITESTTSVTSATVTMARATFNSNATNFNDNDNLEVRFRSATAVTTRLYKVGLWVRVRYVKKSEVFWRLVTHRRATSGTTQTYFPDARFLYEPAYYSNPTTVFMAMGSNSATNGSTIRLYDMNTSDTSATGGTLISTVTPGTTYARTTNAVTLTSGDRYVITNQRVSGTTVMGGAFIVIRAQE